MAFNFLRDVPELFEAGGGLYKAAAGIRELGRTRNPYDEIPVLQAMVNAAEAARVYARDAANPESANFRNLAALTEAQDRGAAVENINRIMSENARARARGSVGFGINPERRDETRAKALTDAFRSARERARLVARDTLLAASQGAANAAGAYAPSAGILGQYGQFNTERRAGQQEAIGSAIEGLGPLTETLGQIFVDEPPIPRRRPEFVD